MKRLHWELSRDKTCMWATGRRVDFCIDLFTGNGVTQYALSTIGASKAQLFDSVVAAVKEANKINRGSKLTKAGKKEMAEFMEMQKTWEG